MLSAKRHSHAKSVSILGGAIALAVAGGLLAGGVAAAQPAADPFAGFENELAPGFQGPGDETIVPIRDRLQPFGTRPNGDYLDTHTDTPINEFAGQTRKYDPGLIGGLLGAAKDSLLGRR